MENKKSIEIKGKPVVTHPFFLKAASLPKDVSDYEILIQAEKVVGYGRAKVAQKIDGLWRVHMSDIEARYKVLQMGMTFRGKAIQTFDRNPHFFVDENGTTIETTKLSLTNLPVSVNDEELLHILKESGIEILSDLNYEHVRSPIDKTLIDRFWNANRFVIIKVPKEQLPSFIRIGKFKVYLKYRERNEQLNCHNCLKRGHLAANCRNETVCTSCRETGHKKGSPSCKLAKDSKEKDNSDDEKQNFNMSKEEGELSNRDEILEFRI